MKCDVLTLFPDIIAAYLKESIVKRAQEKNLLDVKIYNIRDFEPGKHKSVDDYPFGGGAGMVIKPEPLFHAVDHIKKDRQDRRIILLSPQGRTFDQPLAEELSQEKRRIVLICGRYEGIDERIRASIVDEEISIGDYVMTGGELAALVIIDSAVRLIRGALGDERSADEESFSWGLLDYPHYTRPRVFRGMHVPDVLLSGNHKSIWRWRRKEALRKTLRVRPDLLKKMKLSDEDKKILAEIVDDSREEE
jgi:tRNA (guanine37-N1)-methyltransferase